MPDSLGGQVREKETDRNGHLGSKMQTNRFQKSVSKCPFQVHFADIFLIPFLLVQTSASQASTIAVVLFYWREESQELIEFCKGNGFSEHL